MNPIMNNSRRGGRTTVKTTIHATALAIAIAVVVLLAACNGKPVDADKPAADATPVDPMVVKVTPEMASNFKVGILHGEDIASTQEVAGRIEANQRLVSRIGASVSGRVTDVLVELGDTVKAGQSLARVASPELTQAQLAVLRASSSTSLAERAVERANQLIAADVIGTAEVQKREADLDIARAELRAAMDQLRLMGASAADVRSLRERGTLAQAINVSASRAGVVIERTISQGQVAQVGDPLFTVADLSNVWVVGNLPEQAASTVEMGQAVTIDVPALNGSGTALTGRVVSIGATVQPDTRTVEIRTQVDNSKLLLKPQMLATMRITGASRKVLAVPAAAIVRQGDRDNVYVKTGENQYRLTPVELGPPSGDLRPVVQGVKEGTEVVTAGAFHLNNERNRAELE